MADLPLAVVIVTYNSRREIDTCLESIYADLGGWPADVVVVDNASTDGTAEHIATRWPEVGLRAQMINQGFAAGNNIGLAATTGDPVLLVNPDTVIQGGAVAALMLALEKHPEAGVIGPMLLNPDGSLQPSCREFPSPLGGLIGMAELYRVGIVRRLLGGRLASLSDHRTARRVDWLSGACLLVRRAAADAAEPLDEGFFMYSEEMEWQYRMAQHGWAIWFEPTARVVHLGGASTAPLGDQRIVWQYQSIFRFYRLYRSRGQRLALRLLVWVVTWPKILFLTLFGRNNAHRQDLRRAFWKVLWLK